MREQRHVVDFCVVGGGMAGLCAAIAAARHGAKVALVQDRPVLGGNASSEIRMWICGAHGENNHETGIIEEILLENQYRNTWPSYSIWDSVLYEKARFQENLTLVLNCAVSGVGMDGPRIASVKGWQTTTETWHTIEASLFADCTGDGTVGAMAGAEFRQGREARSEFGESIAPEQADRRTMGMSCLIQARETDRAQPFIPPSWAYRYESDRDLPDREHTVSGMQNFWWLEVGGMQDSIHDTEELRDELLKIAFGIWDHVKNRGEHGAANWALDWVGFLPGKRESRRLVGDHVLTQNDVSDAGRHFADIVGFGGWTMDDHFPEGFYHRKAGTIFHPAPSPYGIPYRCLYSRNVENLFFAGRDISTTHTALSSTRVMATCATLGQAVGTAASLAVRHGLSPRGVYERKLGELQQTLMADDAYLPFNRRAIGDLTRKARLAGSGNLEALRSGIDRQIGADRNSWDARPGEAVELSWDAAVPLSRIRLVFDSDLSRSTHNMVSYYPLELKRFEPPRQLVKTFTVEVDDGSGSWRTAAKVEENHQRLVRVPVEARAKRLRFTPRETWAEPMARIFALDVE